MLLFIYGEETYLVGEKLDQIKQRAIKQSIDATNTATFDGTNTPFGDIRSAVLSPPFLAEQRLVVVRDWLLKRTADEGGQLAELAVEVPETTILAVVEYGQPDRRRKAFDAIKKAAAKTWECKAVTADAAVQQAIAMAAARNTELPTAAARELVDRVGADLGRIGNEAEKLSLAADGAIDAALVSQLVAGSDDGDVFALIDAVGQRRPKLALKEWRRLILAGEAPLGLLALLTRHIRTLLVVQELAAQKVTENEIAKQAGQIVAAHGRPLHPFVVKKATRQANGFTIEELKTLHAGLADLDFQIKTGKAEAEVAIELWLTAAAK